MLDQHMDWKFIEELKALDQCVSLDILKGDVVSSVVIDDKNISKELEYQASKLLRWSSIALRATKIFNLFESTVYKNYLSHVRQYAKWYMKSMGEKDTIDGREEAVIRLFSKNATKEDKGTFAEQCFLSSTGAKDKKSIQPSELDKFSTEMYDVPSYEDMITRLEEYRERKEFAIAISDAFRQRGYSLTSLAEIIAKGNFAEGLTVRDSVGNINTRTIDIIRKTLQTNPDAPNELLSDIINAHN